MKRNFFVLAALLMTGQLLAQADTTLLGEAVITANKFPSKTSLSGKVVTIIDSAQLSRSGARDLPQILSMQAGIYVPGANSNPGKEKSIYLWGENPALCLIMIDGIPVYDPTGIGGNFDLRNLSLSEIERIEIVKGSQSTLYGSDAVAGVINIITKKAGNKKQGYDAAISYGSLQTLKANAGIKGHPGKVDYNLGYSYQHSRGLDEATSTDQTRHTDHDGFTENNITASVGIQGGSHLQLKPFFRYAKIRGDIDQGAFTDELDFHYTQESLQSGMTAQWQLGKTRINLLYQYNHIDRFYIDDSTLSRNGFDTYSNTHYEGNEHLVDLFAHYQVNNRFRITIGTDFRRSHNSQLYVSLPAFGPPSAFDSSMHQESVYAAINYYGSSGLNVEAGGRINFHSAYDHHTVYNLNPSWLIKKQWKLFVNLSSGYRTPSLYQLYSEYGNRQLKPEAATSMEAGIQYFSSSNKVNARVVYFNRHLKDGIFFYFNPVTYVSQYINQDKQKDHGFELELATHPTSQLDIRAHYTYVNGRITTRSNGKDTTYFNLLRRPQSSAGCSINYQLNKKWQFSSSLNYYGDRKDSYFDNNSFTVVNTTLRSYALLDLYAAYSFRKGFRVYADLRNLTNSKFTEISGFNTIRRSGYIGLVYGL